MISIKTLICITFVVINTLFSNFNANSAVDVSLIGKSVTEKTKNVIKNNIETISSKTNDVKDMAINKIDTQFQKQYPDSINKEQLTNQMNQAVKIQGEVNNVSSNSKQINKNTKQQNEEIPDIQVDNVDMNKITDFAKKNLQYDESNAQTTIERGYERKKRSGIKIVIKNIKDSETNKIYENLKSAYDALNEDKLEVAIYYYKKTLSIDPKNKQALFGLGVTYQRLYQDQQAIDIYNKMLLYKYKDEKVINNLMIAMSNKDTKEALDMLIKIQNSTPNDPMILGQIGTIYLKMKEYEKSIPYLTKAISMSSDNVIFAYNLALSNDGLGNQEEALYYYQFALQGNISSKLESSEINKIKQRAKDLQNLITKQQKEKEKSQDDE